LVGVQLSLATAIPRAAAEVSDSQEITLKDGQVSVGDVLSSMTMDWTHVAVAPHRSVAVQVLYKVPVPIQPFIWFVLSWWVIVTAGDNAQRVVPVAVPVLAGVGGTLHDIVMVAGQVMVT